MIGDGDDCARETTGRLLNRELSTLEYNARLLELAADESLPLLERVKMCRFFSSNLDEFFMVRVAGLMGQAAAGLAVRSADGLTPRAALAAIRERVIELTARQSKLWKATLRPALADEGIVIAQVEDLDPRSWPSSRSASSARSSPCSRRSASGPASRSRTSPASRSASACSPATRSRARSASRA